MALLIGAESESATAAKTIGVEKGILTKRVALKTGKLETLKIKVAATSAATKYRLGLFKASSEKPSTFIVESGTITVAKETALTVEAPITATEITEGVEYFLGVVPIDAGSKIKATNKTGWGWISTAKITELNKGVFTTEEAAFGEPIAWWGEGTEGGGVTQVAGTTKVKLKDSDAVTVALAAAGTTKVTFKDSAALAATLAPAGTTKVRFATSASSLAKVLAAGTTKVRFVTAANVSSGEEEAEARTVFMIFEDF